MVREMLEVQGRRANVATTELALAFPLPASREATAVHTALPPLSVFAYLPLRSYGLKFLLQADWIVPSSRESVDDSSPWNQWLREEVPPLFQRAILRFVEMAEELLASDDASAAAHLMNYALGFVPLPGMTTDFFASLAPACCQRLRSCRCILTATGQFVLPSEAVLLSEKVDDGEKSQRQLLHIDSLVASSGLNFAHRDIAISSSLAHQIEVRRVDASLITEVLSRLCTTTWRCATDVDIDWLTWALSTLQRDSQLGRQLEALRKLPMLPLADGYLGRGNDGPLYEASELLCDQLAALQRFSSALAGLKIIEPKLLQALRKQQATSILSRLKVQRLDSDDVVRLHVVPALALDTTATVELPHLLTFARAQAAQCHSFAKGGLERCLREARARLCTTRGDVVVLGEDHQTPLQLPQELWPRTADNKKAFDFVPHPSPTSWMEVAIPSGAASADPSGWRTFFSNLGVDWFPAILPCKDAPDDWESPALDAVLSHLLDTRDLRKLQALAEAVAERWQKLIRTRCVIGRDSPEILLLNPEGTQRFRSRLLTSLQEREWLLGTDGQLHRPDQLWLPSTELKQLLGDGVPFLTVAFPGELISVLNIQSALTPSAIMPLLEHWASQSSYVASENQMAALLSYLCKWAAESKELQLRLSEMPCIWVPEQSNGLVRGGACIGRFYRPMQCVLIDPSCLIDVPSQQKGVAPIIAACGSRCLGRVYDSRFLASLQPTLGDLGVREQPSAADYVAMLRAAASASAARTASLHVCYRIFHVFSTPEWWTFVHREQASTFEKVVVDEQDSREELRDALESARALLTSALADEPVFPAASGDFQPLSQIFFFIPPALPGQPSDAAQWSAPTLEHAVFAAPDVHIPNLYSLHSSLVALFETVLQLRPLSRGVREAVIVRQHDPPIEPTHASQSVWLYAAAGAMQRFFLKHKLSEEQAALTASNFRGISLQPVAELSVCLEVMSPAGEVLERAAGVDRIAHLSEPSADDGGEPSLTLYYTREVDAEELAKALLRALPREAPDDKLLILTYVLLHVWSWEGKWPRLLRDEIFKTGDAKWQRQPVLPDGVEEWLRFEGIDEAEQQAAAEVEAAAQMERAMERERAMLAAFNQPAQPPPGEATDEQRLMEQLAQLELDPALASAVQRLREQMSHRTTAAVGAGDGDRGSGIGCGGMGMGGSGGDGERAAGGVGLRSAEEGSNPAALSAVDISGAPTGPRPPLPDADEASGERRQGRATLRHDPPIEDGDIQSAAALSGGPHIGGPRPAACPLHGSAHSDEEPEQLETEWQSSGYAEQNHGASDAVAGRAGERVEGAKGIGNAGPLPLLTHPDQLGVEPETPRSVQPVEWQATLVRPELVHSLGYPDTTNAEAVGQWGERLVAAELAHAHDVAGTAMVVNHVNLFGEQGRPYDITVSKDGCVDLYVEVKTTVLHDKPYFDVTLAELDMARMKGSAYAFYRVLGAGSDNVRLAFLRNPAEHIGAGLGLLLAAKA